MGQELKDFFKSHGVRQLDIARRIGMSVPSVTQFLNAYRPIPSDVARKLQDYKMEIMDQKRMEVKA